MPECRSPAAVPLPSPSRCCSPETNTCNGRPLFSNSMASVSPLQQAERRGDSPLPKQPALRVRGSAASRNSSLPTSPLDDIPEQLWPRVLRTTGTPETSHPDLSLDELTSTRLSVDDENILTSLPREDNRSSRDVGSPAERKGFSGLWRDNSDRLKKMSRRLRRLPADLFPRGDRRLVDVTSEAPNLQSDTSEPKLPSSGSVTGSTGRTPLPPSHEGLAHTLLMDYECNPKDTVSCSEEEMSKISSLIKGELRQATRRERTGSAVSGWPQGLPRQFADPPIYYSPTVSFPKAKNRQSHELRGLKSLSQQLLARTSSLGSVEELRNHAFGHGRLRRPGLSGASTRQSSAPSVGRSSRPASRPGTNSESIHGSTIAPRRPRVYMDAPCGYADSVRAGINPPSRPTTSSTARPRSKSASVVTGQEDKSNMSPKRQPEVEVGMGDRPGYTKVPLYVPRRIEKKQACGSRQDQSRPVLTPVPATPNVAAKEKAESFSINPELSSSNPAISDVSFTSLQCQTSMQSQSERDQALREFSGEENDENVPPSTGGRGLSRALTSAWSEKTSRKKQKNRKRNYL
ncbi:hypothetical protein ABEF95_013191 [Exophiala dermatitidis]